MLSSGTDPESYITEYTLVYAQEKNHHVWNIVLIHSIFLVQILNKVFIF